MSDSIQIAEHVLATAGGVGGGLGGLGCGSGVGGVKAGAFAVVGLQWGDEGKGKLVDLLADRFDGVVRYNGGANAGHSVVVGGERYALHLVPSGILRAGQAAVIGNGVVVDPDVLLREMSGLSARGVDVSGLVVSDRAHVVMPYHKAEDELREALLSAEVRTGGGVAGGGAGGAIGTTKRGIGPCYADKAQRATAVRVGDLLRADVLCERLETACRVKNAMMGGLAAAAGVEPVRFDVDELVAWGLERGEKLRPCVRDTVYLLHEMLGRGERLLFEGANATLLDVDHGTYPFVTSSSTTALGIMAGAGVPACVMGGVLGVVKAYSTRVGNGPMSTELLDGPGGIGERIRVKGREFGTTTGRPRRVGWLDLVAVRYSAMLSGVTGLAVTLLDVLSGLEELKVCVRYRVGGVETDRFVPDGAGLVGVEPVYETLAGFGEEISGSRTRAGLPAAARGYLELIERVVGVPVRLIGVGPEREQVIAG